LDIPIALKVKVPKLPPPFISVEEIGKLTSSVRDKQTHKGCGFRDLVLVETAVKTGLRRGELANLRVRDIDFIAQRLKVVGGKGEKNRVIPLHPSLSNKLRNLCSGMRPAESVFGLTPRSLGEKIRTRAKKAGVPLHAHSLRHYFVTTLVDRGQIYERSRSC